MTYTGGNWHGIRRNTIIYKTSEDLFVYNSYGNFLFVFHAAWWLLTCSHIVLLACSVPPMVGEEILKKRPKEGTL